MKQASLLKLASRYLDRLQQAPKIQVNIIKGNVDKLCFQDSVEQVKTTKDGGRFPQNTNWRQGQDLFNLLLNGSFIAAGTNIDNWLWTMGYSPKAPQHLQPIQWLKTKEQLRTVLNGVLTANNLDSPMKVADIERLVPQCFIDKDGSPLHLSKPKTEISREMDLLKGFFDRDKA